MTPEIASHMGRKIEDWGMLVGLCLGLLYGIGEIVVHVVVSLGIRPYTEAPFPWIIVMFFLGCILPKTLGRATTGQVWVILAGAIARLIPRGKNGSRATEVDVQVKCPTCSNALSACVCVEDKP